MAEEMGDIGDEARIRDFLAAEIERLPDFIKNLDRVTAEFDSTEKGFFSITSNQGGPSPVDLIRRVLSKRNLRGIESLHDLQLVDTEFVLLQTGRPGFQPSADILAINPEDSQLFLVEVKQLVQTERQAVTELAAYSHGLNSRLWNLTGADYVWMPICTDWRTTVRAAFANKAIWSNRSVLPMRCKVTARNGDRTVAGVELNLLSLLEDVDEPLALSQFAWDCFDTLTFQLAAELSESRALLEFISATAARQGFSGFVFYGKSAAADAFPYPYVYAISVHNPLRAALKRRQLEIVRDHPERGGVIAMRKQTKGPLFSWHDIDFRTMKDRETSDVYEQMAQNAAEAGDEKKAKEFQAIADEDYLSLREMAGSSGNRTRTLFREIKSRLKLFFEFDVGTPHLKGLLNESIPVLFECASTFGLFQEALCERLQWEVANADKGDGPVIGDYGGDPLYAIQSAEFVIEFLHLMNFEHDCQTDYEDDEAKGADDE